MNLHKINIFAILFVICFSMFLSVNSAISESLTIDQSIDIALANNPDMHIARENIKMADALVNQALSAGMPKVTAGANYQRLDKETFAEFGDTKVPITKKDNRSANLNVAYNIDLFGSVKSSRYAASEGKKAYKNNLLQTENNTVLNVKTAFYNVLRARRYLQVQQETTDQLKAHLKDTQINFEAGTIAKYDVLRAETQVANAEQALISSSNGVLMAKAAFNTVLGRPVDTQFDLIEPESESYPEFDLQKCLDSAVKFRPEVLSLESMTVVGDQYVTIAKNGSKPNLNLQWTASHNFDTSSFNSREDSWTAMLTAGFSIFDGGYNKSQVQKAKTDANNYRFSKDQAILGVTLDAQQSYLSRIESKERIIAAEKALIQAEEAYRLAVVRYKSGVSTQLEVLDAETALTAAKTNKVNAMYDYQIAMAKLEKAVGGREAFAGIDIK